MLSTEELPKEATSDWPYPVYCKEWLDELSKLKPPALEPKSRAVLQLRFQAETGISSKAIIDDYCDRYCPELRWTNWGGIIIGAICIGVVITIVIYISSFFVNRSGMVVSFPFLMYATKLIGHWKWSKPLTRWHHAAMISGLSGAVFWTMGRIDHEQLLTSAGMMLIGLSWIAEVFYMGRITCYSSQYLSRSPKRIRPGSMLFLLLLLIGVGVVAYGVATALTPGDDSYDTVTFIILCLCLDHFAPIMNRKDDNGQTLLSASVMNGDAADVATLLAARADPNIKNRERRTALDLAHDTGNSEIINLLVENGAIATGRPVPDSNERKLEAPLIKTNGTRVDWNTAQQKRANARECLVRAAQAISTGVAQEDDSRFAGFDRNLEAEDLEQAFEELKKLAHPSQSIPEYWTAMGEAADSLDLEPQKNQGASPSKVSS